MIRSILAAVAVYVCGYPAFDGARPAAFDRPLQGFYNTVNAAADEGKYVLGVISNAHVAHFIADRFERTWRRTK